jgi:hypothetical protein
MLKIKLKKYALHSQECKLKASLLSKLAVKQNGNVLRYVKEQTEEICKIAVKQNGDALRYVKN